VNDIKENDGYYPFSIVESREPPAEEHEFKKKLERDETLATEFIGASVEECRAWAHQNQGHFRNLDKDIFFVIDERSDKDETLLIQFYQRGPGLPFPKHKGFKWFPEEASPSFKEDELLPQKADTWYSFRIRSKHHNQAVADLTLITAPDAALPFWFRRTAEFTTEDGIFDPDAITRALEGRCYCGYAADLTN
jgi:hypothetical protein